MAMIKGTKRIIYQDDWILKHYEEFNRYGDLAKAYNEEFNENLKRRTIERHCKNALLLKSYRELNGYNYSHQEMEFIRNYYPDHGAEKTSKEFYKRFGRNKTPDCIIHIANHYNIHLNEGTFKKLCSKANEQRAIPIGEIHIYRGRAYIKTENGLKLASRVVWEKEKGKIPNGYNVIHLDGDPTNCDISNLFLLSQKDAGIVNVMGIQSGNPELVKLAILWCKLYTELGMTNNDLRNFRRKYGFRND